MKFLAAAVSLAGLISSTAAACDDDAAGGFAFYHGGTTGGASGESVTVTTQEELTEYAIAEDPYIIKIPSRIDIDPVGTAIKVGDNKTIIGSGAEGEIYGGGVVLDGSWNVIIRNLKIGNTDVPSESEGEGEGWDAIQMNGASNVWIDHCLLTHATGSLISSRRDTTNTTVSYSHLLDSDRAFEIGSTDNVVSYLSVHHNWFQNLNQSNPSADNVKLLHFYNNLLSGITSSGHHAIGSAALQSESVFFEDVHNPIIRDERALLDDILNVYENCTGETAEPTEEFPQWKYYEYYIHQVDTLPPVVRREAGPKAWVCQ